MTTITELIQQTRSYRRFDESKPVSDKTLIKLINLARLSGSARNVQPLKYMPISNPEHNCQVFPHLGWAGYISDWSGPIEGERPSAYIICLLDTTIFEEGNFDLGIASQNILLGATEIGLGGCRIATISPNLRKTLSIEDHLQVMLVIALGVPKEEVEITKIDPNGDIKYWRDKEERHYVPKRNLEEILISPPSLSK